MRKPKYVSFLSDEQVVQTIYESLEYKPLAPTSAARFDNSDCTDDDSPSLGNAGCIVKNVGHTAEYSGCTKECNQPALQEMMELKPLCATLEANSSNKTINEEFIDYIYGDLLRSCLENQHARKNNKIPCIIVEFCKGKRTKQISSYFLKNCWVNYDALRGE